MLNIPSRAGQPKLVYYVQCVGCEGRDGDSLIMRGCSGDLSLALYLPLLLCGPNGVMGRGVVAGLCSGIRRGVSGTHWAGPNEVKEKATRILLKMTQAT